MSGPGSKRGRSAVRWVTGFVIASAVVANLIVWYRPFGWPAPKVRYEYPTYSASQVAAGEELYQSTCSVCHGGVGEGSVAADVPALDASMHAWHHPDSQIARMIREGGVYMPPVAPEWDDAEVAAVLAYIKERWEPRQRAYQFEASRANP